MCLTNCYPTREKHKTTKRHKTVVYAVHAHGTMWSRLLRTGRSYPILAHDQFVQLLQRGINYSLVERDSAVLEQVHAVADLKDLAIVVCDHNDRYFARRFQAAYEVQDQSAFLGA